ncbi:T9SS type A sorting domain-containing protein [Winogradskyella psychrotolerans]|uniref:T9SS type A sorting domain-containing protein n=1 Tax=Winogradskyella psychrotolerans TaxID=1344585 RepID=UPI001C0679E6|nr:T9SS type A sorting domain-containing protein [Winogradskyella psychrotolerans]MBU2929108.1 T9SS type A sorting domain-containing protein [Winogradskyella psychrotolerans]
MKKITITTLFIMLFSIFTTTVSAQIVGYTYTLVQNSQFNYTIGVVPDASTSDFIPFVQSYGCVIFIPDGMTIEVTNSFGGAANPQFFDGAAVGFDDKDGYLITESLGSQTELPSAPSAGEMAPMITINIIGEPTSGLIEILANDSALTQSSSQFKSFLTADSVDDDQFIFEDLITTSESGLSGDSSFDFATLSTSKLSLSDIGVYPNPVEDTFSIKTAGITIDAAQIYNINGALVKTIDTNAIDDAISISDLNSGVYFLQLSSGGAKNTTKLIKQ